jgi:hypothetical protein
MSTNFIQIISPLALFILFLCIQVFLKPSEIVLTILSILFSVLALVIFYNHNEGYLFLIGVGLGVFVEIVLGMVARQQHWDGAHYLSVPLWLPIVWGIGFVMITRLGIFIRGL